MGVGSPSSSGNSYIYESHTYMHATIRTKQLLGLGGRVALADPFSKFIFSLNRIKKFNSKQILEHSFKKYSFNRVRNIQ